MIIALQTLIFFRESLIAVLDRFLRPYYKRLSFQFKVNDIYDDDDDSDEHVFAEFDDEKGVVFYPPVYVQRYAAVVDCLMDERWCGSLEKVVDFGYHNMSFIKYLKDVPGLKYILGVDVETIPVRCSSDLLECESYVSKRESPLQVTLFQGNAADPDYRLIGCDAVIAIEMIEHMLPHDLERFVHTVFGFIKPRVAIITTPNGDFNVLFKALEKNGLRRLDHFFEWSREQFHDWCSNIVARYPQYTVVSKGIGPGPPDTLHLGCCSQLALFYAKDYQKQPDLNLNSLALVAKAPSPNNLSDMTDSWETPDSISDNMLYLENKLNCSMLQVKKFSKVTLGLLAKNKTDNFDHTREVVDEIRHLTKMLNFNKDQSNRNILGSIWCNINWGENAPYWNQYYKTVREYAYPFEIKSDECRILDAISEEINRLIDVDQPENFTTDTQKLEIPIRQLMEAVEHITTDVDKVKDLLEWNGYDVVDDVVIHTRLTMDNMSLHTQEEDLQEYSLSDVNNQFEFVS
nr:small RNA 2'-O-methyltransferase isoform X2 [Vanessa tameamea]